MARQGGRFPQRKPAPVPITGTFEDNVARLRAASSNRMANSDEFRDAIGLEAGPATVGINTEVSTVLRPTIGPATPRDKFEPLLNEVARLNTARREAGVGDNLLDSVNVMQQRQLAGGVPAAVQNPVAGGFDRVHMDYERGAQGQAQYNPITSKLEAVPYLDPVTGKAMVTELGNVGRTLPGGHDKASEYLSEQLLKLTGRPVVLNNRGRTADNKPGHIRADLIDSASGEQIDAQIKWNAPGADGYDPGFGTQFPTQIYTSLDAAGGSPMRAVQREMRMQDIDPITATENLIANRQVAPGNTRYPENRMGKLMKNNPKFVPMREKQFDKIIMPGMAKDDARRMGASDKEYRNYEVVAPTSVQLVDLGRVNEYLQKRGGELSNNVFAGINYGDEASQGRVGAERYQLHINLPNDATVRGEPLAENVLKIHPLTQQLLARQPII